MNKSPCRYWHRDCFISEIEYIIGKVEDALATKDDIISVFGEDAFGFSATTTHGAQINPYIYVGGGLGIYYDLYYGAAVPIYADFKVNVLKGRISPVLDMRLGYSAGEISGLYASIMPGCQFGLKGKTALTLSLGYEFFGLGKKAIPIYEAYHNYTYYNYDYYPLGGLSVKLALDF